MTKPEGLAKTDCVQRQTQIKECRCVKDGKLKQQSGQAGRNKNQN